MTLKELEGYVYEIFYGMETLTHRKKVKARKPHTCDLCNETILKGDFYLRSSVADSGTVYSFNEHLSCGALVDIIGDGEEYFNKTYNGSKYKR